MIAAVHDIEVAKPIHRNSCGGVKGEYFSAGHKSNRAYFDEELALVVVFQNFIGACIGQVDIPLRIDRNPLGCIDSSCLIGEWVLQTEKKRGFTNIDGGG